ncbi:peroxiredoxin [Legionella israelensis]|uniref:thioredoxin-dependent peroxiredoxin n=1 Tax=Legionella israelensis TaxID=454 RepID=A0A0W0WQI5_9GAMM|nr:peroxiredoxin [Legionella israelensis]KTD34590.1 peroxiredoxin, AhpC/TSA family protein [Legionella israelensis]QBS09509.1 peroxiredoxin [Legionella israelensis]QDP71645.1 peroxiredoxin [Legionella israelensis]SCY00053.1 peroxiredoxin Q/BCP [Legionella israelensis DSM 19235]STX60424.1 peroxiredoxin, AhpC/TSA family protein [Legionella israelensis]
MKIGDKIECEFMATNNLSANLADYAGKWLVLYFYPKDSTPGCTTEGQCFRDAYSQFQELNTEIFGVSRDGLKSHNNFKIKQQFPFELISDGEGKLCELFDVIKMKSMFGKQALGIERSTFIIDGQGVLRHEWRKVKVKGHVDEVLATLKKLQQSISNK